MPNLYGKKKTKQNLKKYKKIVKIFIYIYRKTQFFALFFSLNLIIYTFFLFSFILLLFNFKLVKKKIEKKTIIMNFKWNILFLHVLIKIQGRAVIGLIL